MKLLEMGKDIKIKQCLLSPLQGMGELFCKKALHGRTNFFRQMYGRMFYMGTNDHIMQRGVND